MSPASTCSGAWRKNWVGDPENLTRIDEDAGRQLSGPLAAIQMG
jgi:catalase-peroxidase